MRQYRDIGRASEERSTALIWAIGAHNIALRGSGVIDGNGRSFINQNTPHRTGAFNPTATRQGEEAFRRLSANREGPVAMLPRPGVLVLLINCEQVDIREVHVVDAPNWCIHLACCRHAAVIGIEVRNSLLVPNADALDVSNCQDVRISDVYLEAGDDGIAISPCADGYCQQTAENITVSNAVIVSRSAGIRLGWSAHDIRNLVFNNVVIRDSNRGIGIFIRGHEKIEHVLFSNVVMETRMVDGDRWGMGEPLHVSVVPWRLTGEQGFVSDLRLVNVTATSEAPMLLYADKPGQIRNVLLDDVFLRIAAGPLTARYGGNLDLRPADPVKRGITSYDMAGLKAENVDDLSMRNFRLRWTSPVPDFFRAGVEVVRSHNLDINGFSGSGPAEGTPAISLKGVAGSRIVNASATKGDLLREKKLHR